MVDDDFAPPTAEEQQLHRTLYDGNAAKAPLPPAPGGGLYTWNVADEIFTRREAELKSRTAMTPAQLQQKHADLNAVAKILPDAADVVAQVAEGVVDDLLAGARALGDDELDEKDLDHAQQVEAWNTEVLEKFTAQYGARDGEALLARTQKFVRSHPRLAALLKEHGLGSRPSIVEGIASQVHSTGWR